MEIFEKIKRKSHNTNCVKNFKVKKGTCFMDSSATNKHRIAVVLKKIGDIVIFTTLTSTPNIHAFIPVNHSKFPNTYFCCSLHITDINHVVTRRLNETINPRFVNNLIKELKSFFIENL